MGAIGMQKIDAVMPPATEGSPCEQAPDLFFIPDLDEESADGLGPAAREHEARLICATCPFLLECGLHALEHEEYGTWGALSERDRRDLGGQGRPGTPGPAGSPRNAVKRLSEAGVPGDKITALLMIWKARKTQLKYQRMAEESRTSGFFEEVA